LITITEQRIARVASALIGGSLVFAVLLVIAPACISSSGRGVSATLPVPASVLMESRTISVIPAAHLRPKEAATAGRDVQPI
jgi:DNA-binding transcriptional regulator YdaS (Cro superfamily)